MDHGATWPLRLALHIECCAAQGSQDKPCVIIIFGQDHLYRPQKSEDDIQYIERQMKPFRAVAVVFSVH